MESFVRGLIRFFTYLHVGAAVAGQMARGEDRLSTNITCIVASEWWCGRDIGKRVFNKISVIVETSIREEWETILLTSNCQSYITYLQVVVA